jgi:hypothetical protein
MTRGREIYGKNLQRMVEKSENRKIAGNGGDFEVMAANSEDFEVMAASSEDFEVMADS